MAGVSAPGEERREAERVPIDLEVEVSRSGGDGRHMLEVAALDNVSGGGLSLLSARPASYHVGQRLHLRILLPAGERLAARLEGEARVVWIGTPRAGPGGAAGHTPIGLCTLDPLVFDCTESGVRPARGGGGNVP